MTIALESLEDKDLFDDTDLLAIKKIESIVGSAQDRWAHTDFVDIYKKVKKLLLDEQDKRCFYCQKQNISATMDDWHIDHIVPMDEDERFTFCDRNLVIACKGCNRVKNNKSVWVRKPKRRAYSKNPKNYRIVHPRFDTYSENIDILGDMFYVGLTTKGRRTVHDCVLDRFLLAYFANVKSSDRPFVEGAMKLLFSGDPKTLIGFIKAMP